MNVQAIAFLKTEKKSCFDCHLGGHYGVQNFI